MAGKPKQSYYFIGIGGIGMSGLAELLVCQGHEVSGSDVADSAITIGVTIIMIHIVLNRMPDEETGK